MITINSIISIGGLIRINIFAFVSIRHFSFIDTPKFNLRQWNSGA
jgi:hypothetical protein